MRRNAESLEHVAYRSCCACTHGARECRRDLRGAVAARGGVQEGHARRERAGEHLESATLSMRSTHCKTLIIFRSRIWSWSSKINETFVTFPHNTCYGPDLQGARNRKSTQAHAALAVGIEDRGRRARARRLGRAVRREAGQDLDTQKEKAGLRAGHPCIHYKTLDSQNVQAAVSVPSSSYFRLEPSYVAF